MRSRWALAVAIACASSFAPSALAQSGPVGNHYAIRSSDDSFQGVVGATGTYSTSVPLSFSPVRGDLPIPLQVAYTGHGIGAVGAGWDIPLSYVRRDSTFLHHRPAYQISLSAPTPRTEITVSLLGDLYDFVPKGSDYISRRDSAELTLHPVSTTKWQLFDGQGVTYTFEQPAATPGYTGLLGTGLWLLTSIQGAGGSAVLLDYTIGTPGALATTSIAMPAFEGITIDLVKLRYNPPPSTDPTSCTKDEISLTYSQDATSPLSLSVLENTNLGDRFLVRMHKLAAIDVNSRDACGDTATRLREYTFTYTADLDTQAPRLQSVQIFGRAGTPEASMPVPVASYTYGTASSALAGTQKLVYQPTTNIPMPAGSTFADVGFTSGAPSGDLPLDATYLYTTRQALTDEDGDGRPDLVYTSGGSVMVALNRPSQNVSQPAQFSAGVPLFDNTYEGSGPHSELWDWRALANVRFSWINGDQVWRQVIDVNGDGRPDIVDASEAENEWVIYLNIPSSSNSGVQWVRRSVPTEPIAKVLADRGHDVDAKSLPLARRTTSTDGTDEKTFTEWQLEDINGDGYPDLVFNSSPVVPFDGITPFGPQAGNDNNVEALMNFMGVFLEEDVGQPGFAQPITLLEGDHCGVGMWNTVGTQMTVFCAMEDVNGDGVIDRVVHRAVVSGWETFAALGMGDHFSDVELKLPDAPDTAARSNTCPTGTNSANVGSVNGLRDVDGDGIADLVTKNGVYLGTGASFGALLPVEVTGGLSISDGVDACDGMNSTTTSGMYDIDGDGKLDIVHAGGGVLQVYQLTGSTPRGADAGRLASVDNGYGARTTVTYASAKDDATTAHHVPFPEPVVGAVRTDGLRGLGGSMAEIRYAYGEAELVYDSAYDRFRFVGYGRQVEVTDVPTYGGEALRTATIRDNYMLEPFVEGITKDERLARMMRVGRPSDVTVLTDERASDAGSYLTVDVATDAHRSSGSHYEWTGKLFEEPGGTFGVDCMDMELPYDATTSYVDWYPFGGPTASSGFDVCGSHGFLYQAKETGWRGDAAPPATTNIDTSKRITEVDNYGQPLQVVDDGDVFRSDDDSCINVTYATPSGSGPHVVSAVASKQVWDCTTEGSGAVYASERWAYDGLPSGHIGAGLMTSHDVDRRATDTGAFLNTIHEMDVSYTASGGVYQVTSTRDDGKTRTLTYEYEPFGIAPIQLTTSATGVTSLVTKMTLDPIDLSVVSQTDENGTAYGTVYDGFGRPTMSTVAVLGGAINATTLTTYINFNGADRQIQTKTFPDPVPLASAQGAGGRVSTTYVDELGREIYQRLQLGPEYGNQSLVAGAHVYDSLGRLSYDADPYPTTESAATAYGTSRFWNPDGSIQCEVRANGPQTSLSTTTDESIERYPTCYSHSFANHTETLSEQSADSLLLGSPQAGIVRSVTSTALGRAVLSTTTQGAGALERAAFTYDRFGNTTSMTRYLDSALAAYPVTSWWRYDSLDQLLEFDPPYASAQNYTYSTWGEATQISWLDSGSVDHRIIRMYDALGRITHSEERTGGAIDTTTPVDYLYDVAQAPTSLVALGNVAGRLAHASTSRGSVDLGYDEYGHISARVFDGGQYIETHKFHADGRVDQDELRLPDDSYAPETVAYTYDSAGVMRAMLYSSGSTAQNLYQASSVDVFGRELSTRMGQMTVAASYASAGRRLLSGVHAQSAYGYRTYTYPHWDPVDRQTTRTEMGASASTLTVNSNYSALGQLSASTRAYGATTVGSRNFQYDALGNVTSLADGLGSLGATLSYLSTDRDRICRIGYGPGGLGGSTCNVTYDEVGNVATEPGRADIRSFGYYLSGAIKSIHSDTGAQASFAYDAFGGLEALDVAGGASSDTRREMHYGDMISQEELVAGATHTTVLERRFFGPEGQVASLRGPKGQWVFSFGDTNGNRFFADETGQFLQTIDYEPFGEATSGGALPGTAQYTHDMWNGGDDLAAFGLIHVGARLYDPVIGRFLSRDPLLVPRTAATTNPYAFAWNDPQNGTDPDGLDCNEGGNCPSDGVIVGGTGGHSTALRPTIPTRGHRVIKRAPFRPTVNSFVQVVNGVPLLYVGNGSILFPKGYVRPGGDPGRVTETGTRIPQNEGAWYLAPRTVYTNPIAAQDAAYGYVHLAELAEAGHGCAYCHVQHNLGRRPQDSEFDMVQYYLASSGVHAARELVELTLNDPTNEETVYEETAHNCFVGGTLVHAERGLVPIEEIRIGDRVWSENVETGSIELKSVARTFVTTDQAVSRLVFFSPQTGAEDVTVTGGHPMWTHDGWVLAGDLVVGAEVLRESGEWAVVVEIDAEQAPATVYNFEVDDFHAYFVGLERLLVHNSSFPSFDRARVDAFEYAGIPEESPTMQFQKVDPITGTVTEFYQPGAGSVGYDYPHGNDGPYHDKTHISAQQPKADGADRRNFPYSGPQHPSRVQGHTPTGRKK
ncbi:MAG TPA: polymorphic toxin-type HINT domain-containing protein [Kofleriaceae bacterium]|jgi:RHS repeat-associated protein